MYISTGTWRDLTDGHLYREGEPFPFDGREISQDRLDELRNARNRAGLALIRASEVQDERESVPKAEEPETASDGPETEKKKPAKPRKPRK